MLIANKITPCKIRQIPVFQSYFSTGEILENDEERGIFYSAIFRYAFSDGKIMPDFSGHKEMQIAWLNIQHNIDKSLHMRRPDNKNANKTQIKRKSNANQTQVHPEDKEEDKEEDWNIKERTINSSKETAEPFSLTSDKSKTVPYTKWTSEQFKAEVAKYPEYAEIADDFTAYWTEPTPKGKMLFQTQKAWDTKRRLARWRQNQSHTPDTEELNNEISIDEQIERMQLF